MFRYAAVIDDGVKLPYIEYGKPRQSAQTARADASRRFAQWTGVNARGSVFVSQVVDVWIEEAIVYKRLPYKKEK